MNRRVRCAARLQSPDRVCVRQLPVGDTATVGVLERGYKAPRVVVLAGVEAEHLLVQVGVKMERARRDIRPLNRALQTRPEILDIVRVNAAHDVADGVVDEFMDEGAICSVVRAPSVGVELRAREHVLKQSWHERLGAAVRHDPCAYAALALLSALHNPEHRCFALGRSVAHFLKAHACDHRMPLATAYEGFVGFDLSGKLWSVVALHRKADAMQHEPRGFLRDAERTAKLMRRGSVLGVGEKPHRRKPLGKRDSRFFEDRADLHGKLSLTVLATPHLARLEKLHGGRAAAHPRARDTVRPAKSYSVLEGAFRVRKVGDGFEQGGRRFHGPNVASGYAKGMAL